MSSISETSKDRINFLFDAQKNYFQAQETKSIAFRKSQLKKLKSAILKFEKKIADALWQDLHKSYEEAYLTEIGIVLSELDNHLKNLNSWSKNQSVSSPMFLFPSSSKLISEPLGQALIVSPWNYPFQLIINPLIGAISAGNCAIIKPSPDTPQVAKVLEEMISETFDVNYIAIIHGGRETNEALFEFPFDIVFFTGSSKVGSIFMENFAKHLTKVVLELGGKSPCIVDESANIEVAARRIIWGKTVNSGQTCIAPDHVWVHKSQRKKLVEQIKIELKKMLGDDIQKCDYYGRMITPQAFERVNSYMKDGEIVLGGKSSADEKFIEPTLLLNPSLESPVMQDEIFGPVLPVLEFEQMDEVYEFLKTHPKPLAFYYFGKSSQAKEVLARTTSGGVCINDTLMHIVNHNLPFGGVGNSGQGNYHGKYSFDAFSHQRAVVSTPTWIDLPLKYAPYKYFSWIKKIM